jgi:hypothetical protein
MCQLLSREPFKHEKVIGASERKVYNPREED